MNESAHFEESSITESLEDTQSDPMECSAGVHFLTDDDNGMLPEEFDSMDESIARKKSELLEYLMQQDGSVVCKLCGELLASRTHWYRHKYKFHVANTINPSPLFKCRRCNVFFKSRKGYMGHISTRHSENAEHQDELNISIKEEVVESDLKLRKREMKNADWEQQREKEEKLVADIIDRVRKECEAQGSAVTRRGYSRRSTVMMNSCN